MHPELHGRCLCMARFFAKRNVTTLPLRGFVLVET